MKYEQCIAISRLILICFAATRALSFFTSSPKETTQRVFGPTLAKGFLCPQGPSEVSNVSSFFMKSCRGNLQARAMPRIALTWPALSSVGSSASKCCRACASPFNSITASWYSDEAPPVSFNALHIFLIKSARRNCQQRRSQG